VRAGFVGAQGVDGRRAPVVLALVSVGFAFSIDNSSVRQHLPSIAVYALWNLWLALSELYLR
jgi:hypothetical protein